MSKKNEAHAVSPADRARIRCQCGECANPAAMCEYSYWSIPTRTPTRGVSFYYYCSECWVKPGPVGGSPAERTGSPSVGGSDG